MKYQLKVRKFEEKDINIKYPFFSENDDLDMYLDSLVEDINNIAGVLGVSRSEFVITITVDKSIKRKSLWNAMKPYFADKRACVYKYVSLESFSCEN